MDLTIFLELPMRIDKKANTNAVKRHEWIFLENKFLTFCTAFELHLVISAQDIALFKELLYYVLHKKVSVKVR